MSSNHHFINIFNTAHIRYKATLEHEESTKLLEASNLHVEKSIHDIEHSLVKAAEKQVGEEKILMQNFNYRKWSSFVNLFRDMKMSKELFVEALEEIECLGEMENFLHAIFWFEGVYMSEVNDYVRSLWCRSGCGGWAFLKCASCKVARYCKEECQEDHFQEHSQECGRMKKERKMKKKYNFLQEVYPLEETEGVSYNFFISKIRSQISHLLRAYIKTRYTPDQKNTHIVVPVCSCPNHQSKH